MQYHEDLYNAVVIAENSEAAFIVEGKNLHAVEKHVADLKKDKSKPELILPLMRNALAALLQFAQKHSPHLMSDIDNKSISLKANEQEQLIEKITYIYTHLRHHDRIELSSMVHPSHLAPKP